MEADHRSRTGQRMLVQSLLVVPQKRFHLLVLVEWGRSLPLGRGGSGGVALGSLWVTKRLVALIV